MHLLDLPPEIFQNIIHELVCSVGVANAWELRSTCVPFSNQIHNDIFTRQPKEAFEGRCGVEILGKDLALYLFNILKTEPDTQNVFLRKCNEIVEFLRKRSSVESTASLEDCRTTFSNAVSKLVSPSRLLTLLWPPTRTDFDGWYQSPIPDELDSNTVYMDQMAILAALGDHQAVQELLASPDAVISSSHFGSVLGVSLKLGNSDVTKTVLSHLQKIGENDVPNYHIFGCHDMTYFPFRALYDAIQYGCINDIAMVLDYYENATGLAERVNYHQILMHTIGTSKVQLVKLILGMKVTPPTKVALKTFERACAHGNPEIVASSLGEGLLRTDKTWKKTSPLIIAVEYGTLDVLRVVLNAGVKLNHTVPRGKKVVSALQLALKANQKSMVQVLLDKGAKLPLLSDWPPKKVLYTMLRDEAIKRGSKDIPESPPRKVNASMS